MTTLRLLSQRDGVRRAASGLPRGTVALLALVAALVATHAAPAADEIRVVDKEVRYGAKEYAPEDKPRPAPELMGLFPPLAPLAGRIRSPLGWEENAYAGPIDQTVYLDRERGYALQLIESTRGIDDTDKGAIDYKIWYRVSNDRGQNWSTPRPLVQQGPGYDYRHPIDGVYVGKNGFIFGGRIFAATSGEIMIPTYRWPLDEQGKPLNPHGAYTYMESGLVIGKWNADGTDMLWECGQFVRPGENESTRGSDESAIAELKTPGHMLMVARGSNQNKPEFPSRKWLATSRDYGRSWSRPTPWCYADGGEIFSPASMGTLVRSRKNGRLYWIGNITPENAQGNYPRFPLVIGQVDEATGGLMRETVVTIDTRNPEHDSEKMQLSNFRTLEDPQTGRVLITLVRLDDEKLPPTDDPKTWNQGPSIWYLIELPDGSGQE